MQFETRNVTTSSTSVLLLWAVLAVLLLLPGSGVADVAGTGSYSGSAPVGGGPFGVSATLDNLTYDVLGESVNLGSLVGSYSSSATWDAGSPIASFTDDSSDAALSFSSTGQAICIANCGSLTSTGTFVSTSVSGISGTAVDNGPGTLPIGSDIRYTYNGTTSCTYAVTVLNCSGRFAFNVFQSTPTSSGSNVSVAGSGEYFNTVENQLKTYSADVTFASVDSDGETFVVASSGAPVIVPNEFDTYPTGYSATFVDVETTATVSGTISTCVGYPDDDQDGFVDGTNIDENSVRLLHEEGTSFVDRTTSVDTSANEVCASTTSLSFFAVAVPSMKLPALMPWATVVLAAGLLAAGAVAVWLGGRRASSRA